MVRNTIHLNEGTVGNISCSVKNHVSHSQKTIRVKTLSCDHQHTDISNEWYSFSNFSIKLCVQCLCGLCWSGVFQLMVLLGLLGGFHIYMRHTSGKKQEDQQE
ncbi:hypothetical protein QQF64_023970 [Cirrhinus molitorella]|uniref:Uncharacterized protein n=1 Tax=Cirrhinus molitorella TaxID=172907 RepID=A0ABR3NKD3_9TELE